MNSLDRCRVLLVEDDEDDYLIVRDMLAAQERASFHLDWCADYYQALDVIRDQAHDVYLIDYWLGGRTGLELVREANVAQSRAPVIILTGRSDYEADLEATSLGVTDYLIKQEVDAVGVERSIRYAISHHRALRDLARSEERFALAVRAANDGIWDWNLENDAIYFAPRWHEILGRPQGAEDSVPEAWFELVHPEDLPRLRAAIEAHITGQTEHLHSEHRMRHAGGTWRWVLTRGLAIRGADGVATRMAGSLSDVTERRTAERQLQHDALHDSLTGLPNRALFVDRLDQILQRAVRDPQVGCAVLFVDIDGFKLVNDSLSHAVGDRLLQALASRLSAVLRPGDTVARLGGDEFTILLDGVLVDDYALAVADRVHAALLNAFNVDGHELVMTASIGIARSFRGATSAELLRNADIAMYDSKRRGRARSAVFDKGMHQRVIDRLACENDLRQAVENSLLDVHYQPIVDLATGSVRWLEALARWPAGWPPVAPLEFIAVAEESGLIAALGRHVMRTALITLGGWRRDGVVSGDVGMSVNVSGRQFDDGHLPDTVLDAIRASGLTGDALRLEITESALMQEPERMLGLVSDICATGVALHLDDFGTGYSSLAALNQYPVDALKIDRSFVAALTDDAGSEAIVRSTVALGHSLGLQVIAEGIETDEQMQRLRKLGCDCGQGYLLSRPLNAEDTHDLLAGWSAEPAAGLAQA